MTLADSWGRVTTWLAAHAPRTHAVLGEPATAGQIDDAARELGLTFPDELVEWWRCVGSVRDFAAGRVLPDCVPYDVPGMLTSHRLWAEVAEEIWDPRDRVRAAAEPAGTMCLPFLTEWVPTGYDGAGDDQFVDLRHGAERGCVMWYSHSHGALWERDWPSLTDMVTEIADGLERGTRVAYWTPIVLDGCLTWSMEL